MADSTNEMLTTYGAPPQPINAIASMIGDGAMSWERALVPASIRWSRRPSNRYREIYERRLLDTTQPYTGWWKCFAANIDPRWRS